MINIKRESVLFYTLYAIFVVYTIIGIYQIQECQQQNQRLIQELQVEMEEIKEIANRPEIMKWISVISYYMQPWSQLSEDEIITVKLCILVILVPVAYCVHRLLD